MLSQPLPANSVFRMAAITAAQEVARGMALRMNPDDIEAAEAAGVAAAARAAAVVASMASAEEAIVTVQSQSSSHATHAISSASIQPRLPPPETKALSKQLSTSSLAATTVALLPHAPRHQSASTRLKWSQSTWP